MDEAARRLGVDASRVRQLLRSGRLAGRRISGRWLVCDEDLAQLAAHAAPVSRPMSPARAWGLLDLLDDGDAPWLPAAARSQLRALLRSGALAEGDARRWRSLLAARAARLPVSGHAAAIRRLLEDPRVVPAGTVAAVAAGADLVGGGQPDAAYLDQPTWLELSDRLRLRTAPQHPDLLVRVPVQVWPFAEHPPGSATLAADLLEATEPRLVRAGLQLLTHAAGRRADRRARHGHGNA